MCKLQYGAANGADFDIDKMSAKKIMMDATIAIVVRHNEDHRVEIMYFSDGMYCVEQFINDNFELIHNEQGANFGAGSEDMLGNMLDDKGQEYKVFILTTPEERYTMSAYANSLI